MHTLFRYAMVFLLTVSLTAITSAQEDTQPEIVIFGEAHGIPLVGDFDGDGMTGIAIFYPQTGTWQFDTDIDGNWENMIVAWGIPGDLPLVGDFNGDGEDDIAVYRPSDGTWYYNFDKNGESDLRMLDGRWGNPNDIPVTFSFRRGDDDTFVGVYRYETQSWFFDIGLDGETDWIIEDAARLESNIPLGATYMLSDIDPALTMFSPLSNSFFFDADFDGVVDQTLSMPDLEGRILVADFNADGYDDIVDVIAGEDDRLVWTIHLTEPRSD